MFSIHSASKEFGPSSRHGGAACILFRVQGFFVTCFGPQHLQVAQHQWYTAAFIVDFLAL